MDTNGDGKIDFTEFVSAVFDRKKILNKSNIEIAFKLFDTDHNGQITKEELQNVFANCKNNRDALA